MPVYSFTLFASFCIFPPTSLTILKCFKCDAVFDGARKSLFLAADYSIRCGGRAYAQNVAYAGAMVFVYPLGVPLLYLCMLFRHRAGLDPVVDARTGARARTADAISKANDARLFDDALKRTAVLWGPYAPRFYLWETWEAVRRLLSTSVTMLFFPRQPPLQIAFSIVVVLASLKMYVTFRPFTQPDDNRLAELLCWILLFSQLSLLVLVATDYRNSLPLGAFMCALLLAALASGLYLIVVDIKREKKVVNDFIKANSTKLSEYRKAASDALLVRAIRASFSFTKRVDRHHTDTAELDETKADDAAVLLRRAIGAADAAPTTRDSAPVDDRRRDLDAPPGCGCETPDSPGDRGGVSDIYDGSPLPRHVLP